MTLGELRRLVATMPLAEDATEVKVWLPGSRISLRPQRDFILYDPAHVGATGSPGATPFAAQGRVLMIEGGLDDGSALCR